MSYTVKQARRIAEKSQTDAAKAIGVCLSTYRKLEEAPENMTIKQAMTAAKFFGIPYDDIFFASNSN